MYNLTPGGSVELVAPDGSVKMALSAGNVFGFVDSQLGKKRSTSAVARTDVTVAAMSMATLERMGQESPLIAVKLMKVLLRQSSLELSNA